MITKKPNEIKKDAKTFVQKWTGHGKERKDDKTFWEDLLEDVFGIPKARNEIEVQKTVKFEGTTKALDVYIKSSQVVIEQKSFGIDLDKAEIQSDDTPLTPMQQAKRYYDWLDKPLQGRYIIACNFEEFRIFDNFHKAAVENVIHLEELPDRWRELKFLVEPYETSSEYEKRTEEAVTRKASDYVRQLYKVMVAGRKNLSSDELHSLNVFCVRWVFCLYAEDAGLFDNFLHNYIRKSPAEDLQLQLDYLFDFLDYEERDRRVLRFALPSLLAFPYVDGGLFHKDDRYTTPVITEEIRQKLIEAWNLIIPETGEHFYWNDISPTNFGCIFESTVEKGVRDSGGMHYTTPANIHRVIGPLFLDELKQKLNALLTMPTDSKVARKAAMDSLDEFRTELCSLRFLDPACGSGNFLTETYKALHELELQAIKKQKGLEAFETSTSNTDPCKVQISQFYGIEIDDFAANVARAAMWIAECQMVQRTEEVLDCHLEMFPLQHNANIHCADALTSDWNNIVKRNLTSTTYIIGNPPFQGNKKMNDEQRAALLQAMPDRIDGKRVWDKQGSLDFVCAWYAKAAEYMKGKKNIAAAFVSTNSIVQGEQVAPLWYPLINHYHAHIAFAWKTFRWFNKADEMAHVHCVIIGFYLSARKHRIAHRIFQEGQSPVTAENINPYLMDAENIFIWNRGKSLCPVPEMGIGNKPIDNGNYLFTEEEKNVFIAKEPQSEKYFHPWYGAEEFINRRPRYCLWLGDCTPAEINQMPHCKKRVQAVADFRQKSRAKDTRELASTPRRFHVENMPKGNYLLVPRVSSENRCYVPMGFLGPENLSSDAIQIVANVNLYHFGVLQSRLHMAWMRIICGRLKSDYRYSAGIVYNNFPWPQLTAEQEEQIGKTAQAILDARALFPDSSLADLYDRVAMPPELLRAHRVNDQAVAAAYGIDLNQSDEQIALELMRRSVKLSQPKKKIRKKANTKKMGKK